MDTEASPTTHWQIIGHERAVAMLANAVATAQPSHAYLFHGPPHIGKRTVAQRLAQGLVCAAPGEAAPCGNCRPCQLARAGHHPDIVMLDMEAQRQLLGEKEASSTFKVETMRQMQGDLSRRPVEARWKILILPEVERMTDAAANAFLKTLEEPPPYVVLLLTTRDRDLLLPTILSRCQGVPLRPLPIAQIEAALVAGGHASPEQAALLARLSGGLIGWALTAARQPEVLTARAQALETLAQVRRASRTDRLLRAHELAKVNDPTVLTLWASWWRDVLLLQHGALEATTHIDQTPHLRAAAAQYSATQVREALRHLQRAVRLLQETNANPQLVWEVLLLKQPLP